MGNCSTYPIYYKCISFKLNLSIIDDQHLDIVIDDILNCPEYKSIYEPIYGRWDHTSPIKYRWAPIPSESESECKHILVYFYYLIKEHITAESIIKCFNNNDRFKGYILSKSNEIVIRCPPQSIPITKLCMRCYQQPCDKFSYGLHSDSVHISLTHRHCLQCRARAITTSDIFKLHTIQHHQHNTIRYNIEPIYDPPKIPFQFQLLMFHAVMKHINVSLKVRDEDIDIIEKEIIALHKDKFGYHRLDILPTVFHHQFIPSCSIQDESSKKAREYRELNVDKSYEEAAKVRKGLIECYCNQLKREHKERKLESLMYPNSNANNQVHHFNYQDDPDLMFDIQDRIKDGIVSPYDWMNGALNYLPLTELRTSYFDPRNLMKRLMLKRYPKLRKPQPRLLNEIVSDTFKLHVDVEICYIISEYAVMDTVDFKLKSLDIYNKYYLLHREYLKMYYHYRRCWKATGDYKYFRLYNRYKELHKKYYEFKDKYGKLYCKWNGKYGNWGKAALEVTDADCDSYFRQERTMKRAIAAEQIVWELLDSNGYGNQYKIEIELQQDPNYDNNKGTPDILLLKPLIITLNGEQIEINWIDMKNFCMWITTKMRWKLWQQNDKYNKEYGRGMFVFSMGYVENINIGNNATIVSMEWLKQNIRDNDDDSKDSDPGITENLSWLYREEEDCLYSKQEEYIHKDYVYLYEDEDYRYNDYTMRIPAEFRDEYGVSYPMKGKPSRQKKEEDYENMDEYDMW